MRWKRRLESQQVDINYDGLTLTIFITITMVSVIFIHIIIVLIILDNQVG